MCSVYEGLKKASCSPCVVLLLTLMSEGAVWKVTGNIRGFWFPTLPSHAPHTPLIFTQSYK